MTALYLACLYGSLDVVKLLVEHCDSKRAAEVIRMCKEDQSDGDIIQKARREPLAMSSQLQKLLNTKTKVTLFIICIALINTVSIIMTFFTGRLDGYDGSIEEWTYRHCPLPPGLQRT